MTMIHSVWDDGGWIELSAFFYFSKIEFLFSKWKKSMLPTNIYGPIKTFLWLIFANLHFAKPSLWKILKNVETKLKQNQRNITFFTLMQLPLANEPLFRNNPKCRPRTLVLYSGMHENEKKGP